MSDLTASDPAGTPGRSTASSARPILIPDAPVGIKWHVPEPHSDAAARLLDLRFELHIPAYFFTEAASVLQRKVAVDRTLSEAEGLEAFHLLRTVPLTIHGTEEMLENAFPTRSALPSPGV